MPRRLIFLLLGALLTACGGTMPLHAQAPAGDAAGTGEGFRAGVAAIDITPEEFPRIIAGSFLEHQASQVSSRLFVRSFVLSDGRTKIALVVVDTCMMPQPLIDDAKEQASRRCDIPAEQIMVSATHTHSAPAAMGCLGTRVDEQYAAMLPGKIAEAILAADANLQPARVGWAIRLATPPDGPTCTPVMKAAT